MNNNSLQKNLIMPYLDELEFLKPALYNQFNKNVQEELISDDNLFRIAWFTSELAC